MVRLLLRRGASVRAKNEDGATALLVACNGEYEFPAITLEAIVDDLLGTLYILIRYLHSNQAPHLHHAVIVDAGSDVNAREVQGLTPLLLASQLGNRAVVSALLRGGALVNAHNVDHVTALHIALQGHFLVLISIHFCFIFLVTEILLFGIEGNFEVAKLLMEWGADPLLVTAHGFSPLHFAALRANREWTRSSLLSPPFCLIHLR